MQPDWLLGDDWVVNIMLIALAVFGHLPRCPYKAVAQIELSFSGSDGQSVV